MTEESEQAAPGVPMLRADMELLLAIAACDDHRLAAALEQGAASPGSLELEHLLATGTRQFAEVELVQKVRPGRQAGGIAAFKVGGRASGGLPPDVRLSLIAALRNGDVFLRKRKVPGRIGRPGNGFGHDAVAGACIHKLALRYAIRERPDLALDYQLSFKVPPRETVKRAAQMWVKLSRRSAGRPAEMRNLSEIDTWRRKVRRALIAYASLGKA